MLFENPFHASNPTHKDIDALNSKPPFLQKHQTAQSFSKDNHPPLRENLSSMLRVNQAGEYGAVRIYEGQLLFLKNPKMRETVQHMLDQEKEHLNGFNALILDNNIAPTLFTPLWHVAGYAMGAFSAMISDKAAHACTIAVEEVIDQHYQGQIDELSLETDPRAQTFKDFFEKCQEEEREHMQTAEEQGGKETPLYPILSTTIKAASRLAIWLSKKV